MTSDRFWETTPLNELSQEQWESLCDGCARCCTQVVQDEETGEFHRLAVACRLLESDSCRCTNYANRRSLVPGCVVMTPKLAAEAEWLPRTCAYRKVARGEPLQWWHPLISGSSETVHEAGISVRGRVISEEFVDEDEALDYELAEPDSGA